MKILIAEDDPNTLAGLAEILEGEGYNTVMASNGRETIQLFEREKPDFVCLDIMMPDVSGYDVCRRIRASKSQVPVIFISGIRTEEYQHRQAFNAGGAVDFLSKPFIPEILLAKVKVFLELYHQRVKVQELVAELNAKRETVTQLRRELEKAKSAVLTV